MTINLRLALSTIRNTVDRINVYLRRSNNSISYETISNHLSNYLNHAPATYNAEIKALRRFMKFLNLLELMESFKMAPVDSLSSFSEPPTKIQVQKAYEAQESVIGKTIFLFLATTGLRKGELLDLQKNKVNLEKQSVIARHFTRNKRSGITFFSDETRAQRPVSL